MFFKNTLRFVLAGIILISCNKKCKDNQDLIKGIWTDNIGKYYFYGDLTYEYKFLRSSNVADTVSVADSAIGTYRVDNCQKVISLTQKGYFLIGSDSTYVAKNINFGTWHYTSHGDTLLEIETVTTYMKLRKIGAL
jgi:hypothetical protein